MTRVDLQRPEVVYFHVHDGEVFHIGSGKLDRAFSQDRGAPWQKYVAGIDIYDVEVVERYACPARARLREAELIAEKQPVTNHHHRNGPHRQVVRGFTKSGVRCDCGAADCYGQEALRRGL